VCGGVPVDRAEFLKTKQIKLGWKNEFASLKRCFGVKERQTSPCMAKYETKFELSGYLTEAITYSFANVYKIIIRQSNVIHFLFQTRYYLLSHSTSYKQEIVYNLLKYPLVRFCEI